MTSIRVFSQQLYSANYSSDLHKGHNLIGSQSQMALNVISLVAMAPWLKFTHVTLPFSHSWRIFRQQNKLAVEERGISLLLSLPPKSCEMKHARKRAHLDFAYNCSCALSGSMILGEIHGIFWPNFSPSKRRGISLKSCDCCNVKVRKVTSV